MCILLRIIISHLGGLSRGNKGSGDRDQKTDVRRQRAGKGARKKKRGNRIEGRKGSKEKIE